ncbi:MAG TPA: hypothetical protein VLT33_41040 [Labilithrix sp.]|nr:hypothetical protein [Labilithrix sp.]
MRGRALTIAALGLCAACREPDDAFDRPTDVAFDPRTQDAVVSDGYNHARVARFTHDGSFLGDFGRRGAAAGELRTPHGVAVDEDGRIYVADRENARVQVFRPNGELIDIWPSRLVGRPWAVAVGEDGHVYVVDGGDQDPAAPRGGITKLTRDGRVVARFTTRTKSGPGGLDGAHAIALGSGGAVYLAESDGRRVRKLVPTTVR